MVKQNIFSNGSEQYYECLVCHEAIYNPLCSHCIVSQLQVWLSSYPDLKKRAMPIIKLYLRDIHNTMNTGLTCISCNQERVAVCPYCFTAKIISILKKLEVNKQILREFLKFFNFDYDETGYTNEAQELGVY